MEDATFALLPSSRGTPPVRQWCTPTNTQKTPYSLSTECWLFFPDFSWERIINTSVFYFEYKCYSPDPESCMGDPRTAISVCRPCGVSMHLLSMPQVREMAWLQALWETLGSSELLEGHCKLKVPLDFSDLQLRQPSLSWSPKKKHTKLLWPLSPMRQSPSAQEKT